MRDYPDWGLYKLRDKGKIMKSKLFFWVMLVSGILIPVRPTDRPTNQPTNQKKKNRNRTLSPQLRKLKMEKKENQKEERICIIPRVLNPQKAMRTK